MYAFASSLRFACNLGMISSRFFAAAQDLIKLEVWLKVADLTPISCGFLGWSLPTSPPSPKNGPNLLAATFCHCFIERFQADLRHLDRYQLEATHSAWHHCKVTGWVAPPGSDKHTGHISWVFSQVASIPLQHLPTLEPLSDQWSVYPSLSCFSSMSLALSFFKVNGCWIEPMHATGTILYSP